MSSRLSRSSSNLWSDSDDSAVDSSLWRHPHPQLLDVLTHMTQQNLGVYDDDSDEDSDSDSDSDEGSDNHNHDHDHDEIEVDVDAAAAADRAADPLASPALALKPAKRSSNETTDTSDLASTVSSRDEAAVDTGDDADPSDDSSDDGMYSVTWTRGRLGLSFRSSARGETVILKVHRRAGTQNQNRAAAAAVEGLPFARAGDVLVAINGQSVAGRRTADLVADHRLDRADPPQPLRLDFTPACWSSFLNDPLDARFPEGSAGPLSPRGLTTARSTSIVDTTVDEYEVVWTEGSLRCALKPRAGRPMVKAVSAAAAVEPSVAQMQPGDVMLEINGLTTLGIGFRAVVAILQAGNKPIQMRFRRGEKPQENPPERRRRRRREDPVLGTNQYAVEWRGGPLGVQLRGCHDGSVVIVKHMGTGDPRVVEQMGIGDVLVAIGTIGVDDVGMDAAFELLRRVDKPVTLLFERVVFQRREVGVELSGTRRSSLNRSSIVPNLRELRRNEKLHRQRLKQQGSTDVDQYQYHYQNDPPPMLHPSPEDLSLRSCESDAVSWLDVQDAVPHVRKIQDHHALLRFSHIEEGVEEASLAATPPPPSYAEAFNPARQRVIPRMDSQPSVALMPPLPPPPSYNEVTSSFHFKEELPRPQGIQRSSSIIPSREVWVRWNDGQLGITFRRRRGRIVISRLTGVGRSDRLDELVSGDWLVRFGNPSIGIYESKGMRVTETVDLIKQLPKPVDLWFLTQETLYDA